MQLQLLIDTQICGGDARGVLGLAQGHSSVLTGARFGVDGLLFFFLTFAWQDKAADQML